jgi:hypothetical protein
MRLACDATTTAEVAFAFGQPQNPIQPQTAGTVVSFETTYAQVPASGTGYYRSGRARVSYGNKTVIAELIDFAAQWDPHYKL